MTTIVPVRLTDEHIKRLTELQTATGLDSRSAVIRSLIVNATVEPRPAPVAKVRRGQKEAR